jgi:hypothetical protein
VPQQGDFRRFHLPDKLAGPTPRRGRRFIEILGHIWQQPAQQHGRALPAGQLLALGLRPPGLPARDRRLMHPLLFAAWSLARLLATKWFMRRATLRLWELVLAFLVAVPAALVLAWLLGWL